MVRPAAVAYLLMPAYCCAEEPFTATLGSKNGVPANEYTFRKVRVELAQQ